MKIAYVNAQGRGEIDQLLAETAALLERRKVRTAGIIKDLDHDSAYENGCDMKVRVLPFGPVIKITQDLGEGSESCRLNPAAIAEAVMQVENNGLAGAQMFILNKFGPEEAAGRGFCAAIGTALEQGIPVLVGVSDAGQKNFDTFAGGLAEKLPADAVDIAAWCMSATQQ